MKPYHAALINMEARATADRNRRVAKSFYGDNSSRASQNRGTVMIVESDAMECFVFQKQDCRPHRGTGFASVAS